jgi:multiple sugar transport system ATP-binding protein
MNFFDGELVTEGAASTVRLAGGLELPLTRTVAPGPSGSRVAFGIRPEHISAVDSGRGKPTRVPVTIEVVEPMGHDVIVTARCAAGVFQFNAEIHQELKTDDRLDLHFDMTKAYLFDADTEDAL